MAPQYKLTYFDVRGIAEPIRYIFHYAGQDFEDHRINRDAWLPLKPTTPFHTLPVLEVDGETIGQSVAIMRFLAKRFGLAGGGDVEQAKVDALVDFLQDGWALIRSIVRSTPEEKVGITEKVYSDSLPAFLNTLQEHLRRNADGKGFFIGSSPTFADFAIANFFNQTALFQPGFHDKFPLLKEHLERVNNLKGIKEWVARRPQTAM